MARKIRRQSKEGVDVSLERLIGGFARGVTGLLGFAANLEAQGKDEYAEQGEITGKTESSCKMTFSRVITDLRGTMSITALLTLLLLPPNL